MGALVATAMAMGGCTGEEPVASGHVFGREDLDGIVLTAADAPDGTRYVEEVSGYQAIETFAIDGDEFDALEADGFVVGHLAWFIPDDHGSLAEPLQETDVLVQGITGLFATPMGASSALRRFLEALRMDQIPDYEDVDAGGLGDESYGLQGRISAGGQVVAFLVRSGNLILAVTGQGDITPDGIRAIAIVLDERASAP